MADEHPPQPATLPRIAAINHVTKAFHDRQETSQAVVDAALALHDATWNPVPHPAPYDDVTAEWDALAHALARYLGHTERAEVPRG